MKLYVVVEYERDSCRLDKHYFGNDRRAKVAAERRAERLRERNKSTANYTAHVLTKKAIRIKGNFT